MYVFELDCTNIGEGLTYDCDDDDAEDYAEFLESVQEALDATKTPSMSPSESPSISQEPTGSPTGKPSERPTSQPTTNVTVAPNRVGGLLEGPTSQPTMYTRPTQVGGISFNPEFEDPNWPGRVLKPGTMNRLVINVQYDEYPFEIDWSFSQLVNVTTWDVNTPVTATPPTNFVLVVRSTAGFNKTFSGSSFVLDQFVGANHVHSTSFFESYIQVNLLPNTFYTFSISDTGGDGICW